MTAPETDPTRARLADATTSEAAATPNASPEGGSGCGCGGTRSGRPDESDASEGPLADASVRRARINDAPAVGQVQAAVWRDAFAHVLPASTLALFEGPAFATAWRASLAQPPSPRHELMLACVGAHVVGFAATAPATDPDSAPGTAELLALGVHPAARRAGHGSRLVNAVVDLAREHGFTDVISWVPIPSESARALLVSAGMGPDGARRERVVDPDGRTVMEVRLQATLGTDATR